MRHISLAIFGIVLLLIVNGCSTPFDKEKEQGDPNLPAGSIYAQEFRGEWIRMDTGERWYIGNNSIRVNGTVSNMQVTLERRSDNVVTASGSNNQTFTLFAARVANAAFSAQVVFLDEVSASQSNSGRSAIGTTGQKPPIRIINPLQPDLDIVVEPDPDTGEIVVSGMIPGDPIELIPNDPDWRNIKLDLIPGWGDDQNMGTLALTQGDNFKVSVRMENFITGVTDLYADGVPREYIFEIENIGTTNCGDSGLTISWNDEDFDLITGSPSADFANIVPGGRRQIRLTLASKAIETGSMSKEFKFDIWNYDSRSRTVRVWEDRVSINYFKVPVPFRFRSQSPVQGVIKAQHGKTYYFMTTRAGSSGDFSTTVNVPWSSDIYTIAFLGA
ncbi:MAG: hypothetical protein LBC80_07830, partial [Treponema sp.]|nr:hypothetical protein [Treponema sp.]